MKIEIWNSLIYTKRIWPLWSLNIEKEKIMLPLNNVNVDFFINIIFIKSCRKWFQKKYIYIYIYIEEHEVNHQQRYFFINQQRIFFFSFLRSVKPPPPVRPATTTAHKRPTPLGTPRRRDPPRWPCQALLCRSQWSGGGGAVPIGCWEIDFGCWEINLK